MVGVLSRFFLLSQNKMGVLPCVYLSLNFSELSYSGFLSNVPHFSLTTPQTTRTAFPRGVHWTLIMGTPWLVFKYMETIFKKEINHNIISLRNVQELKIENKVL